MENNQNYTNPILGKINLLINTPTVGASGAVFGILLAFGILFPNTLLYIYFALPIKAKYFVILYGILELYLGLSNNPADNVAHFAHLGGAISGLILKVLCSPPRFFLKPDVHSSNINTILFFLVICLTFFK